VFTPDARCANQSYAASLAFWGPSRTGLRRGSSIRTNLGSWRFDGRDTDRDVARDADRGNDLGRRMRYGGFWRCCWRFLGSDIVFADGACFFAGEPLFDAPDVEGVSRVSRAGQDVDGVAVLVVAQTDGAGAVADVREEGCGVFDGAEAPQVVAGGAAGVPAAHVSLHGRGGHGVDEADAGEE
jgi:hypothetical protein